MKDTVPRFVELALSKGLLTRDQARAVLKEQQVLKGRGEHQRVGEIAISKGWLDESAVGLVLQEQARRRRQVKSHTLKLGKGRLGDYELLSILGKGGMGAVYKARDPVMKREVAVKVLGKNVDLSATFVKRFQREIKLAGALNHPNIVCAYGAGEADGLPYLAMELVEGETLKLRMKREGRMKEHAALEIIKQIAAGLAHAHAGDLVHRDVKPANVLITRDGAAKLADMGLAKSLSEDEALTKTGVAVGTPHYMSPEQAKGDKQVDHRSDIYSLGAMLYEMLAGEVPFKGENKMKIMLKHVNEKLRPPRALAPAISEGADAIVIRMMAKKPDERYDCCEDVVEDIDKVLSGKPMARPVPAPSAAVGSAKASKTRGTGRQKAVHTGRRTRVARRRSSEKGCLGSVLILVPLLSTMAWALSFWCG